MSRTTRQHRIAAVAATRRWRQRQAKGIRLVTVEGVKRGTISGGVAKLILERAPPSSRPAQFDLPALSPLRR